MTQNLNTQSVTIDKRAVPSRRPTKIHGLGLEGMRLERTGVGRNKERRSVNALRRPERRREYDKAYKRMQRAQGLTKKVLTHG
jgi:hypothetical protein